MRLYWLLLHFKESIKIVWDPLTTLINHYSVILHLWCVWKRWGGGWDGRNLLSVSHPSFLSEEAQAAKLSVLLADLTHLWLRIFITYPPSGSNNTNANQHSVEGFRQRFFLNVQKHARERWRQIQILLSPSLESKLKFSRFPSVVLPRPLMALESD